MHKYTHALEGLRRVRGKPFLSLQDLPLHHSCHREYITCVQVCLAVVDLGHGHLAK